MRWALAVLVVASIVMGASTSRAAAAGPLPDCAPGTPAPAPPTAAVTGNPATPGRIVAGRFFTIVEAGQLLAPGIGVGEGPLDRAPRLDPLPRVGVNTGGPPVLGRVWTCRGLHARVPVTAILREERNLRRRPSESSSTLRIDMPDLCQARSVTAGAPGVALRFIAGSRLVDEGDRTIGVSHTATAGRRYWLQILQGTRLLASGASYPLPPCPRR